jgi:hypothetical protein
VDSQEFNREWKHGPIGQAAADGLCIVCCFRNPWAWLVSMYRWSFANDRDGCPHFKPTWSFREFLQRPHYAFAQPLDRWNTLNRHYLQWLADHPRQGIAVRSEDLLGPELAMQQYERIGTHFGWQRVDPSRFHVFQRRVNNLQGLDAPMDFAYYTERRYLHDYDQASLQALTQTVDPWVIDRLEYASWGPDANATATKPSI